MTKTLFAALALSALAAASTEAIGATQARLGARVEDSSPAADAASPADEQQMQHDGLGGVGYGAVEFDDMTPCFFYQTVPFAKKWYKHWGLTVKGPNDIDGAAVLDECSFFGVTGHTAPNFLAFNCSLIDEMANGGTPVGPETLILTEPAPAVQFSIGSGPDVGETVLVTAKNLNGKTVASSLVTLTSAMQPVFLYGSSKIKRVTISVPTNSLACAFVVDDIYWGTP